MRIDLSCPAEVFRIALPTEEIPAAGLVLFNLSDRTIVSVEASLRLKNGEEEEIERLVYRARALNGRPHATFPMNIPCTPAPEAVSAEAQVEKVWYADNAVWRRESGGSREYTPNDLPISRGLTNLKYVAGETAVGYPSQQDGLWVCVCGRPNGDEESVCARCHRPKDMIFARYNREAVEKQLNQKERQLELQSRSVREDTARLQRIREEEFREAKRRKGRRLRLMLGAVCACALTAVALGVGVPALRLREAERALEAGALEPAEAVFADLGAFPGAEALREEARRRIARRDAQDSQDPETLLAAIETLQSSDSGEDAALAEDTILRRAGLLLEAGAYADARAAVALLPAEDARAGEFLRAVDYAEAVENMDGRYFVLARQQFLALGDYLDAAERADACVYLPALTLMESGEYDAAIAQFAAISEYEDSAELILRCWYLKGDTLEHGGHPREAAEAFLAAGEYADAADRARALFRALGDEAFLAANFDEAMDWYARLPEDEEAQSRYLASAYTLARRAVSDLEYRRAAELLELLPAGYENTDSLREQVWRALGTAALEREDWAEALSLLERLPDTRANGSLKNQARYGRAAQLIAEENWAEAYPLLVAMESYQDARRLRERAEAILYPEGTEPPEESTPAPETTPEPTPEPTAEPTPEPTLEPTATPVPVVTEAPLPLEEGSGDPFLVQEDDG